jgi:VanZ family protein
MQKPTHLTGLLIVVLAAVFYFGLHPRDYDFKNHAVWLEDRAGIRFSKYSLAYTAPLFQETGAFPRHSQDLTILMALRPQLRPPEGFSFILALHDGRDEDQLILAQWRTSLVIMNGDDYRNIRKIPRIVLRPESIGEKPLFIAITSDKNTTRAYLDGRRVKTKPGLKLRMPRGPNTRITLGNSVYAGHSWQGDIYGLAFFDYAVPGEDIASFFQQWAANNRFPCTDGGSFSLCYDFNEKSGTRVTDYSENQLHLELAPRMRVLQKELLSFPGPDLDFNRSFWMDTVVNFAGFVPLGFILAAVLGGFKGPGKITAIAGSLFICLAVSLTIELLQAWIPSRSSSLLDLALNTGGGFAGAMIVNIRVNTK